MNNDKYELSLILKVIDHAPAGSYSFKALCTLAGLNTNPRVAKLLRKAVISRQSPRRIHLRLIRSSQGYIIT